jgi:hypothetical protein
VPGTFTYNPAAGTVLSAGTHTLTATFIPAATTDYTSGGTVTTISSIEVERAQAEEERHPVRVVLERLVRTEPEPKGQVRGAVLADQVTTLLVPLPVEAVSEKGGVPVRRRRGGVTVHNQDVDDGPGSLFSPCVKNVIEAPVSKRIVPIPLLPRGPNEPPTS